MHVVVLFLQDFTHQRDSKMDGGKTKRVGGRRSLFRLMGEGEGEVEMESNFKDSDY